MKTASMGRSMILGLAASLLAMAALAEPKFVIKPLAQRKVAELPAGQLYWRIENCASVAQAQAAAGPFSLVAESAAKVWLFTLGAAGGSTPGATKVAEVGPIPRVAAHNYLLRINDASGPPGSATSVHSHPGSEAYFVLSGEQSIRGPEGVMRVEPGEAEAGLGVEKPMQVSSSGAADLHALVMFVVDADRPFATPAALR